jgi:hypothetical protein
MDANTGLRRRQQLETVLAEIVQWDEGDAAPLGGIAAMRSNPAAVNEATLERRLIRIVLLIAHLLRFHSTGAELVPRIRRARLCRSIRRFLS